MPAYPPDRMISSILDAIAMSGGTGLFLTLNSRAQPKVFGVSLNERSYTVAVYIWTLTSGGRASLPNEYRIQMTSVSSPLDTSQADYTVLMGYYPDHDIFAGFDIVAHTQFTAGSPSVQIACSVIMDAIQNGLAFGTKNNQEVAVGIRPDQFLFYVEHHLGLHRSGNRNSNFVSLMNQSSSSVTPVNINLVPQNRRKIVTTVNIASRNARFSRAVLSAYDNRCAVTRMQLKIVDAAHILPVSAPNSYDIVPNGIALSPTFHRAFDNRLIYLDESLNLQLNRQAYRQLRTQNLIDGFNLIDAYIGNNIYVPQDITQRPDINLIIEANKYRRIPGY